MRFKAVPPTPPAEAALDENNSGNDAISALATARDALPLVPRSEDDCCGRLVDRIEWIEDRDVATEWILFLRALGLAERSDAGYARVREKIDANEPPGKLAANFREHVVGVEAVIEALEPATESAKADPGLRTPEALFEALRGDVPEWERRKSDTWEAEWQERTERILSWATAFGIAERVDGGYRRT